jgi:hypothetical protein
MPGDGLFQDGDDAELLSQRERGEDAALGNAEHGLFRHIEDRVQTGIAVAGDD